MPIEIKELVIKATVALDCENKTVNAVDENIVCINWPDEKKIALYVKEYFNQQKVKSIVFDQSQLTSFLQEWQASLLR